MSKLQEIKNKVLQIKDHYANVDYVEGDSLLTELFEAGEVDWLIQTVESFHPTASKKPSYMDLDD
ncbi:hypothetical protein [Neobacillus drentensis]|uniref:hypothetical protein n=1 Tax=Neobacillus drentensis TaxID=220684 RepID=UPI0028646E9A|nr:hypothetical protein [Neobacillus drentensis]MDR7237149.1 hypothetical protein [Neobacillus drentensis]